MLRITKNICCGGGAELSDPGDAAIYLVYDENGAALIDAGTGRRHSRVVTNISKAGVELKQIKHIFLTHCHYDHAGGAERLRNETGASLIAHAEDARFLAEGDAEATAASWYGEFMKPLKVDVEIDEKEKTFTVGNLSLTLYHIPGHSPGSMAATMRSEDKLVLFGQDVHGPLHDVLRSDRGQYRRSLEFLRSLQADILCEGHFGVFHGKEEVADFIESFL